MRNRLGLDGDEGAVTESVATGALEPTLSTLERTLSTLEIAQFASD